MKIINVEEIVLNNVCRLIRSSLCLEESTVIDPNSPIKNIKDSHSAEIDSLDLLEIFYKCGFNAQKYCSGERLTERGRKMVLYVLKKVGTNENEIRKFQNKEIVSINECLDYLTPIMLAHATIYAQDSKELEN